LLNVILLIVILLNVILLKVILLNVIELSVVMLNVVIMNVILLNVIRLSFVMLDVVRPGIVTPFWVNARPWKFSSQVFLKKVFESRPRFWSFAGGTKCTKCHFGKSRICNPITFPTCCSPRKSKRQGKTLSVHIVPKMNNRWSSLVEREREREEIASMGQHGAN